MTEGLRLRCSCGSWTTTTGVERLNWIEAHTAAGCVIPWPLPMVG